MCYKVAHNARCRISPCRHLEAGEAGCVGSGKEGVIMTARERAAPLAGPPRDLVGYGRRAPKVVWPDQAKVGVSLVLNYEEGSEHYQYAGDAATDPLAEFNYALDRSYRDFSMESVYEYGSRAGIWRLPRIFDEYGLRRRYS
jgi:hypothetical protein